jgi:hypothetical protein
MNAAGKWSKYFEMNDRRQANRSLLSHMSSYFPKTSHETRDRRCKTRGPAEKGKKKWVNGKQRRWWQRRSDLMRRFGNDAMRQNICHRFREIKKAKAWKFEPSFPKLVPLFPLVHSNPSTIPKHKKFRQVVSQVRWYDRRENKFVERSTRGRCIDMKTNFLAFRLISAGPVSTYINVCLRLTFR